MNPFEIKGEEFLDKIFDLVEHEDLKIKDSLFEVLDHIRLKKDYHLGLKVANEVGLGDESFFFAYHGEEYPIKDDEPVGIFWKTPKDIFEKLIVEPSEMGAWQAYLLWISPTVLPLYWHGGYIRREYFFDKSKIESPTPTFGYQEPITLSLDQIPQPMVSMNGNKAIVTCPYWNNWKGLVQESVPFTFAPNGRMTIGIAEKKVLYEYDCGICY